MKKREKFDFENLLEHLPYGVLYLNDDKIVYINSASESILGLSREKILSKSIYSQQFSDKLKDTFRKLKDSGKTARLYEENFVNYFGKKYILNVHFVPVITKNINYLLLIEDYSFLKEVEKKSNEYSNIEKLSTLFASMAHEIKNPLGVIKGTIQLVEKQSLPLDSEALNIIISEVNRIEKVIQELLNYSNPQRVNEEYVNIHQILDKSIVSLTSLAKEKSVMIFKEYDTTLPNFLADPETLYRALFNVIKNAIEACSYNGKVVISTKVNVDLRYKSSTKDVNYVSIEIADNGEGMSEEDLKRIFTPFFTKKAGGTGLGMVYVQKVVLDHNGFLNIWSMPKEGTKVSIYLPMKGAM
ncbi:MAG: ATP-binding protein [Proteobacteria bacterium]|nr:ATP-binding protein [Pseudomonadota bacterium]